MVTKIEPISKDAFKAYGQVIELPVEEEPTVSTDSVTFWKQQSVFSISGETQIGVLKVRKMDMVFDELENHFKTPTGLICLDGDFVVAVAEPSDTVPKAEEVRAFRAKKSQLVVLAEKCWHSIMYPVDQDEITVFVIFDNNALEDDTVFEALNRPCELGF
jgi:ureidoglycolate hydrolase